MAHLPSEPGVSPGFHRPELKAAPIKGTGILGGACLFSSVQTGSVQGWQERGPQVLVFPFKPSEVLGA